MSTHKQTHKLSEKQVRQVLAANNYNYAATWETLTTTDNNADKNQTTTKLDTYVGVY
jgi:hypothetical protein